MGKFLMLKVGNRLVRIRCGRYEGRGAQGACLLLLFMLLELRTNLSSSNKMVMIELEMATCAGVLLTVSSKRLVA